MQRDHAAEAAKSLSATFPDIKIDNSLGRDDEAFCAKYMRVGGNPLTLGAFLTSLLQDFLPPPLRVGLSVKLSTEGADDSGGSKGIRVQVETAGALSPGDPRKFTCTQVYRHDGDALTIYLGTVVAPGHGRPFVKTCLIGQGQLFHARKLALRATQVGGSREGVYVWARYGFVPAISDWNGMRAAGLDRLKNNQALLLGPVRESLTKDLLDPSPKALRRIVYLSWTVPENLKPDMKKFLDGILDGVWSWDGELDLTDPPSLAWIQAYANGNPPAQFKDLVPAISGEQAPPSAEAEASPEKEQGPDYGGFSEEEVIAMLAEKLYTGEITEAEVQKEYPKIIEKVRAARDELAATGGPAPEGRAASDSDSD
jgi:hypothetical protein